MRGINDSEGLAFAYVKTRLSLLHMRKRVFSLQPFYITKSHKPFVKDPYLNIHNNNVISKLKNLQSCKLLIGTLI